ncbi:MAG: HEAT repeat domain-containing protein, partial [Candidatus Eisenbacteria bacterium]|nr:HEAT repeat domain-containing protein [Candidatus Eisenbacteria bacterium]
PALEKVLLHNPRPGNRETAAKAIGIVARYTGDRSVIPTLVRTLSDSVTGVQWNAAKVLFSLGDTTEALPTILRIAQGVDKENWSVEWGYYTGIEHMSQEQVAAQAGHMRDAMQIEAIRILGRLATKEAVETLRDLERRLDGVGRPSRVEMEVLGALHQAGQQPVIRSITDATSRGILSAGPPIPDVPLIRAHPGCRAGGLRADVVFSG